MTSPRRCTSGPGSTRRASSPPCWRPSDGKPWPKIWRSARNRGLFHRISTDFSGCRRASARIAVDALPAPAYAHLVPRPTFLLALVSPIRQREKALAPTPGLFFNPSERRRTPPMPVKRGSSEAGALRLDRMLLKRGLARSRAEAQDLIKRGLVAVAGSVVVRTATPVSDADQIVLAALPRYVSRGGLKLAAALDHFAFAVDGVVALDLGASTGGFTQVLIERGAARVYAVDVGHGQLHPDLRQLPRVVSLEGLDARALDRRSVPDPIGAIVADVSFISLGKVLPAALALAQPATWLVALIKPQFEVGRGAVGKGGIVRDAAQRQRAIELVRDWLTAQGGWRVLDVIPAPIRGGSGNQEFLLGARHDG